MDPKTLQNIPPWEWPRNAGKVLLKSLTDKGAKQSDRLIAAELAGDFGVINEDLARALMTIVRSADEPDELRAQAAISFGPVLEQADTDEFEDPESVPIAERTFHKIRDLLHQVYVDGSVPKQVRRKILEASVRAQNDWHRDAIREAYASGDREWMLTAVLAMGYVRGFDEQIVDALKNPDPEIHREAVSAAGNWELDAAWPHVVALVNDRRTPKPLLRAAIEAVGAIRPKEAGEVLVDLADSTDEEIAEAADEAMTMADAMAGGEADEEEDDDEWIN